MQTTAPRKVTEGARALYSVPVEERNTIRRQFIQAWEKAGKPNTVKSIIEDLAREHNVTTYNVYGWTMGLRPHHTRRWTKGRQAHTNGVVTQEPPKTQWRLRVREAELIVKADDILEAVSGHGMGMVVSYSGVVGVMQEDV